MSGDASHADDGISEEDVVRLHACLHCLNAARFAPRERTAIGFFDLVNANHHAINDETFQQLSEVFGTADPVLSYQPGDIDRPSSVSAT